MIGLHIGLISAIRQHELAKVYIYVGVVKNLPAIQETQVRSLGQEDPLEEGSPLQYSCLENPTDRGARQATVHRVPKSQTRLKRLSVHTSASKSRGGAGMRAEASVSPWTLQG